MVKGQTKNNSEAFQVLDELVRQAFLFLGDNPSHVAKSQPSSLYQVSQEHDKELTDRLKEAGILSEGYVAVLSGNPTKTGKTIDGGDYQLMIYNTSDQRFENNELRVNTHLYIKLTKGSEPGIQNASGTYTVSSRLPVIFEEAKRILEVFNKTREISIAQKVTPTVITETASDVPDDVLAFQEGKIPLNDQGSPIPDSLFPNARQRLSAHPVGTRYEVGKYDIACYFPKGK